MKIPKNIAESNPDNFEFVFINIASNNETFFKKRTNARIKF